MQEDVGDRLRLHLVAGLLHRHRQRLVRCLTDEVGDRGDAARQRGAGTGGVVVGPLDTGPQAEMDVRVDAAGQDQLAGRVDVARAGAGFRSRPISATVPLRMRTSPCVRPVAVTMVPPRTISSAACCAESGGSVRATPSTKTPAAAATPRIDRVLVFTSVLLADVHPMTSVRCDESR